MERAVGIAPLVAGLRMGATVFSYAGELTITLLGDRSLADWETLGDGASLELHRLAASGEVTSRRGRRQSPSADPPSRSRRT